MKRLFQISRIKPNASAPAAAASAALPSSGFTFVDNSQGASAAASELSTAIESALDQIDLGGDLNTQLKQLVHGLDREASTYDNSKVNEKEPCIEWKCSRPKAQLVSLAWKCAHGTYHAASDIVNTTDYTVQSDYVEAPSLGGSVKAWTSTLVSPTSESALTGEFLPVLVIAIRGSASKIDHVVNANERPKDVKHFIDPNVSSGPELLAHAGFLNSAQALDNGVSQRIDRYLNTRSQGIKHVLFTGHSAGGAVASLLFLHYISMTDYGKRARLSCITFGSPPSLTAPIDLSKYQTPDTPAIAFNLINEFDLVSRADRLYVLSLVNLVRSMYGQRPIPLNEDQPGDDKGNLDDSSTSKDKQPASAPRDPSPTLPKDYLPSVRNVWPVPKLVYHHVGPRVVLLMRLDADDIRLRAVEVPDSEFEKLLFCRIAVHSSACYSERVRLIRDGAFNRRRGWTGKELDVPMVPGCL